MAVNGGGMPEDDEKYSRVGGMGGSQAAASVSSDSDTTAVLRISAETRRDLALWRGRDGKANKVRVQSSVKLPEPEGNTNTSVRKYREWRKGVDNVKYLNELTDTEFAMLRYSQRKGRPKSLLEVIEPEDLQEPGTLAVMHRIFDETYENMSHERLGDLLNEWETAHRRQGQTMQEWCTYLRKLRLEVQVQDNQTKVSDQALASKMLCSSWLTSPQRA